MKNNYIRHIPLRCITCGSSSDFKFNDDKSYVKCAKCDHEYYGGYDELVELNQAYIQEVLNKMIIELKQNVKKDIHVALKKAFKGNKHIKIK